MINKLLLAVFAIMSLVAFCAIRVMWSYNPWLFRASAPIPPQAYGVETEYSGRPFYDGGILGRETVFTFEANNAVESVRTFYRTELLKRGWTYDHAKAMDCSPLVRKQDGFTDKYDKGNLSISISNGVGNDVFRVYESEGVSATTFSNAPQKGLKGYWQAINQGDDTSFTLCFDGFVYVKLTYAEDESISGYYKQANTDVQIVLVRSQSVRSEDVKLVPSTLCSQLPALFRNSCQFQIIDPASHRTPDTNAPTSNTNSASPPVHAYPVPERVNKPFVKEVVRIDGAFTFIVDQDTLTLTSDSGATQVFRRVVQ